MRLKGLQQGLGETVKGLTDWDYLRMARVYLKIY